MVTRNTVLVLGAGASKPYGFPTGAELRDECVRHLPKSTGIAQQYRSQLYEDLTGAGFEASHVVAFQNALDIGRPPSIDFFASRRPGFRDVARHAIASLLLDYEAAAVKSRYPHDWYDQLWYELSDPPLQSFGANRLTVVTFNYERSLERFLQQAMCGFYGCGSDEAGERLLKTLTFVHIHGSLGLLPGFPGKGTATSFGGRPSRMASVSNAAASIRIVGDDPGRPIRNQLASVFRARPSIYFVGFGYQADNIQHLLDAQHESPVRFPVSEYGASPVGTSYELPKTQATRASEVGIVTHGVKALPFIRDHIDFARPPTT